MLSMYLLTYIVVFVMCEGGDWATTRRMSCLHKGVWVPGVHYLRTDPLAPGDQDYKGPQFMHSHAVTRVLY